MPTPLLTRTETIAGYTIRERIGAGGYGEVWRAEAPGGLEKAIKFVYGQLDESRAACELKALHRVKEARHPFLLSLERFEVIDGQLIIVTELAERSLKDRYDECRQAGAVGIPRDELLRYMSDAADALDYLRERYSLQHLDIKPENLLILGGHVKVADFGLVKDLQHTNISLVEGLTPIYAPPEAFDDHVSSSSDQYSLAIVYQEMLTGVLPFPGRTASQLAMQHRYSRPQLGSLPESDRAAIARALSKDPADRFPGCRDMVDSLLGCGQRGDGLTNASAEAETPAESFSDTTPGSVLATELVRRAEPGRRSSQRGLREGQSSSPRASLPEPSLLTLAHSSEPARLLPPVALPETGPQLRPTLFLGIGGSAAKVLRRVRARLQNRFGDVHTVPSLAMLLVDTDRREIAAAVQGDEATALDYRDTLLMPLHRAEQYRARSDQLLKWLSRRWLYNIPNSLQTDGLRPLGRLALVDHVQAFSDRLRGILQSVTSQESTAASAAATGWEIAADRPRVFILASISGGTGGGMVIDTAYLVRQMLRELCLPEDGLCGILLHGVGRRANDADVNVANACACLLELEQYCRQGYPGDEACRLPAFGRGPAFQHTYLVYQGDDLDEPHRDASADAVAEYLYLNAAIGNGFFDVCRQEETAAESCPGGMGYRTFGLSRTGCLHSELVGQTADVLASAVLQRWLGTPAGHSQAGAPAPHTSCEELADRHCGECVAKCSLSEDAVVAEVRRLMEGVVDSPPDQIAQSMLAPILDGSERQAAEEILAEITAAVGPPPGETRPDDFSPATWQWRLWTATRDWGRKHAEAVRNHLWETSQQADLPLSAVRQTLQQLDAYLNALGKGFRERSTELESHLGRTLLAASAENCRQRGWFGFGKKPKHLVCDTWQTVYACRLEQTQLWVAEQLTRFLRSDLACLRDQLGGLLQEIGPVVDRFRSKPMEGGAYRPEKTLDLQTCVEQQTRRSIREHLPELMDRLAAEFARQHVHPRGGLKGLLENRYDLGQWLPPALQTAARRAAVDAIRGNDALPRLLAARAFEMEPFQEILCQSAPGLSACGGGKRLVVVLPQMADDEFQGMIQRAIGEIQAIRFDFDNELVVCQELEQMSFAHVAAAICQGNPAYAEIATRLHTRIDVSWKRMRLA